MQDYRQLPKAIPCYECQTTQCISLNLNEGCYCCVCVDRDLNKQCPNCNPSETLLVKINNEVYNKANEVVFDTIPEFLAGEEWHWNNGADLDHLEDVYQIKTFFDFLQMNYNFTPVEMKYLRRFEKF